LGAARRMSHGRIAWDADLSARKSRTKTLHDIVGVVEDAPGRAKVC